MVKITDKITVKITVKIMVKILVKIMVKITVKIMVKITVKIRLDVSLLGRDSGDFSGTLGTFVTSETFLLWGLQGLFNIMHQASFTRQHAL